MKILIFGKRNKKLSSAIATLTLPSGYTCPGSKSCHAKANRVTGKIIDSKNLTFRCYHCSLEACFPNVRQKAWHNFDLLKGKSKQEMIELIQESLPNKLVIRPGEGGDFFNQDYFDAWLEVAKLNKHILFYAYTKSINFWIKRLKDIPKNFILTASYGGKYDSLISKYNLKHSKVFNTIEDARREKYKIDIDDSLARNKSIKKIGLLLHGNGPAGSFQARLFKSSNQKKMIAAR